MQSTYQTLTLGLGHLQFDYRAGQILRVTHRLDCFLQSTRTREEPLRLWKALSAGLERGTTGGDTQTTRGKGTSLGRGGGNMGDKMVREDGIRG